jgi:hemerythrin-like metal-binding protein
MINREAIRRIGWSDSFNLGIAEVDAQHREMMALVNAIGEGLERGNGQAVRKLAGMFLARLDSHFKVEEGYLRRLDYPQADNHVFEHRKLLEKASGLCHGLGKAGDPGAMESPYEDFLKLLIRDLLDSDIQYKTFVEEFGLRDAPAQHF